MATAAKSLRVHSAALFAIVVFWHATIVFTVVDLCDAGGFLANQYKIVHFGKIEGDAGMTLFSNLAGGLWNAVYDSPSLLWSRCGGILINGASAVLSYLVVARFYPGRRSFQAVLGAALLIPVMARYDTLIHYLSVPVFLSLVILALQARVLRIGSGDASVPFLSGMVWVLMVLSRFPLVVLAGLPAALALWECGAWQPRLRRLLFWAGGAAVSAGAAWLIMRQAGVLEDYLSSVLPPANDLPFNHWAVSRPWNTLVQQGARVAKGSLFSAGAAVFLLAMARMRLRRNFTAVCLATLWSLCLVFVWSSGPANALLRFGEILYVVSVSGTLLIAWLERENPLLARTLFIAALLLAPLPLGSAVGLTSATYGLWFCLPALMAGTASLIEKRGSAAFPGLLPLVRGLVPSMVVVAVVVAVVPVAYSWSGDLRWPRQRGMGRGYAEPGLRGVFDNPRKAEQTDQALRFLRTQTTPGDVILCYNHLGMLYWLTRTRTLLPNPNLYHDYDIPLRGILEEALIERGSPRAIVLNLGYPPGSRSAKEVGVVRGLFVDEKRYSSCLKNDLFEILCASPREPSRDNLGGEGDHR